MDVYHPILTTVQSGIDVAKSQRSVPKNYDGIKPTGRLVESLLDTTFKKISASFDARPQNIFAIFLGLINEQFRPLVKPVFFADGKLIVKVKNSTLLSILTSQEKGRLLHNLRDQIPSVPIQDIVFQIG